MPSEEKIREILGTWEGKINSNPLAFKILQGNSGGGQPTFLLTQLTEDFKEDRFSPCEVVFFGDEMKFNQDFFVKDSKDQKIQ